MFSLFLGCAPDEEERLAAELWELGTAGITDEPGGLRAFFEDDSRREPLLQRFAAYEPESRTEADTDWERASRDAWPAIEVGRRLFLAPPWNEQPTPQGRLRLLIHPGMACGTGWHPCTQLCLEALERHVRPGSTVLDVGAGSGILSDAARLLGAGRVLACDVDADAVEIACRSVNVRFFVGSADAVRSGIADIVVANISSAAIEALRPELERVRKPGGTLILSGFQDWDPPEGFEPRKTLRKEAWLCMVC